jgi:ubiquitin-protein ligase
MLLATPNPGSPLNRECAEQYKDNYEAYRKQAAKETRMYA